MPVDLHTHSNCSDGTDPPGRLVVEAARAGLRAVALTDHDTLSGIPAAREAAAGAGVELIPGIEISCEWEPGTLHMLVLYLEPGPGPLQDRLDDLGRWREERNRRMLDRLAELGVEITPEELEAASNGASVGRPHVAAVMVGKGIVPDMATAFDRYLAKGKPGYVDRPRLSPNGAISLARSSGALPVVAHPHTLGLDPDRMATALADLEEAGLVGLECYYADYRPAERNRLARMARELGLIPTGGSDYHGAHKPWLRLGSGQGDLSVPDQVLDELLEARRRLPAPP